ncbi:hypothetical protein [Luteimonas lutimaris]
MTSANRRFLLSSMLMALLAGVLFLPGLGGGFVFDDESNIVNNQGIRLQVLNVEGLHDVVFSPQPGGITRVLPTVTFALDYWRGGGLNPAVFKATNITIHVLTAFVLAWFFRALLLAAKIAPARVQWAALALAMMWAVHPLQVSSVLYVVQRMQTMSTLFLVLALLGYLKARVAQIEGRRTGTGWLLALLFWVLALGCKEDAILLPAYALALELTVLRFAAASPPQGRALRRAYLLATMLGTLAYLFVVIPHYWHWDAYPGREFSSWERLLTQGRVLCMYIGQILVPLPRSMPFYYDWVEPSRGWLQPWTTLPAILLVLVLLGAAWKLRTHRPLFALGVFVFFAGHFVTSNVLNLELAFEHRNHFPLIGAILAIGDLLAWGARRLEIRPQMAALAAGLLLAGLSVAGFSRAVVWSDPISLATKSTEIAPRSARAWISLSRSYLALGGGHRPDNPYLGQAIDACTQGAAAAPYSVSCPANLVIYKTLQGTVTKADWGRLHERLQHVAMGPQNRQIMQALINNAAQGRALDEDGLIRTIEIFSQRGGTSPREFASFGYFIMEKTHQPEKALHYFELAVDRSPDNSGLSAEIRAYLRSMGRTEWAEQLEGPARTHTGQ